MTGQKFHFELAYYYSVFHMINSQWSKEKAKRRIEYYLSCPMEVIIESIEKDAPLDAELFKEIVRFKEKRNWLVNEFNEESTLPLILGKRFELYIKIMDEIIHNANAIMKKLNEVDEKLKPQRG